MKKTLGIFIIISMFLSMFVSVQASAEVPASDAGYTKLDLSLTKTVYDAIGQEGKVTVAIVNEKTVNMYKLPAYGATSTSSLAYLAVKVDAETKAYVREGSKEDITRPQRTIITEGLTYSVDNPAVITLNEDGSFVTSGYGIANITAVYDAGTAGDVSDDVTNSVTIICSDDHRMSVGQEFWTNSSSGNSFFRLCEFIDGSEANDDGDHRWGEDRDSTDEKAYQGFRLNWDPMGDSDGPLVAEAISTNVGLLSPLETHAAREGGYVKNSPVVMHAWFYDSMSVSASGAVANFISFGYSGTETQGQKSFSIAGYHNGSNGISAYRLFGGDYTTRSASYFTNKSKDTSSLSSIKPEDNPSGYTNVAERTKGWHQFVVTAEPSMVNPGTDYLLTKVYLDGKLITAQDIYVGNIPINERQCNVRVYSSKSSADITVGASDFSNQLTCYKDIYVAGYKNSKKIEDSIPSDGAENVPLYHPVKIKLGSALNSIDDANITFKKGDTELAFSAQLDETKTILTLDAGKYTAKETYTVTVNGETVSFTTGDNTHIASVLEEMQTDSYVLSGARYIDFSDESKTTEEYGVGFSFNTDNSECSFSDGVLTVREGIRAKEVTTSNTGSNYYNGLIIRSLSEHNNESERIIVTYKVKCDKGYSHKQKGYAVGFSVPVMAVDNIKDAYNPTKRNWLSPRSTNVAKVLPYISAGAESTYSVDEQTGEETLVKQGNYTVTVPLVANNQGGTANKGQTEGTSAATNSLFSVGRTGGMSLANQIDEEGYIRFTFVVDVDPNGVKTPVWRFVIGDDWSFLNRIFALRETGDKTAYTSVDALFLPLTHINYTVASENLMYIKDIQIYNLEKNNSAKVGDTITVTKTGTDEIVYSDSLKNVTVDASISAEGSGSYTAVFAVHDATNNMLHAVKTVSGEFTQSESEIKAEGIEIPDQDNLMLYAYVWSSLDDTVVIKKKIPYSAVNITE